MSNCFKSTIFSSIVFSETVFKKPVSIYFCSNQLSSFTCYSKQFLNNCSQKHLYINCSSSTVFNHLFSLIVFLNCFKFNWAFLINGFHSTVLIIFLTHVLTRKINLFEKNKVKVLKFIILKICYIFIPITFYYLQIKF